MKISDRSIETFFSRTRPVAADAILVQQRKNSSAALRYIRVSSKSEEMRKMLLDPQELRKLREDSSRVPTVQKFLEAIFFCAPDSSIRNYQDKYIRAAVTHLEKLSNGALVGKVLQVDAVFIAYVLSEEKLHSVVIAYFGLNTLRERCPNFQFFYLNCAVAKPIIEGSRVLSWIPRTKENHHVEHALSFWEFPPVGTLESRISNMNASEFLRVYLQVLLAIQLANLECQFCHYQLTPSRVHLRKVSEISIRYHDTTLTTDELALITGFEKAHARVKINGRYYHFGAEGLSTFPEDSWLPQDAYMLLMNTMLIAQRSGNEEVFDVGRVIHRYFIAEDTLEESLVAQKRWEYHLPATAETRRWSIDGLLTYIRANIRCPFLSSSKATYATHAEPAIIPVTPEQALDYYDLRLQGIDDPRYPYATSIRDQLELAQTVGNRTIALFDQLGVISKDPRVFGTQTLQLLRALDLFASSKFLYRVGIEVCKIQKDYEVQTLFEDSLLTLRKELATVLQRWDHALTYDITDEEQLTYFSALLEF